MNHRKKHMLQTFICICRHLCTTWKEYQRAIVLKLTYMNTITSVPNIHKFQANQYCPNFTLCDKICLENNKVQTFINKYWGYIAIFQVNRRVNAYALCESKNGIGNFMEYRENTCTEQRSPDILGHCWWRSICTNNIDLDIWIRFLARPHDLILTLRSVLHLV